MKNKQPIVHSQELITVVGAQFVQLIVPKLVPKAFDCFQQRALEAPFFQVSVMEGAHSTSAILLTAIAIESFRTRISYLEGETPVGKVPEAIARLLVKNEPKLPAENLVQALTEVFILRDLIVHNHLYKISATSDEDWRLIEYSQELLEGYGDPKRRNPKYVDDQKAQTVLLKLNVQPSLIGFEDVLIALAVFDLFVNLADRICPNNYVPFRFFDGNYEGLSSYLANWFRQMRGSVGKDKVVDVVTALKGVFSKFVSASGRDAFINYFCPKCGAVALYANGASSCWNCAFRMG